MAFSAYELSIAVTEPTVLELAERQVMALIGLHKADFQARQKNGKTRKGESTTVVNYRKTAVPLPSGGTRTISETLRHIAVEHSLYRENRDGESVANSWGIALGLQRQWLDYKGGLREKPKVAVFPGKKTISFVLVEDVKTEDKGSRSHPRPDRIYLDSARHDLVQFTNRCNECGGPVQSLYRYEGSNYLRPCGHQWHGGSCDECGLLVQSLYRYERSNHGTVYICHECKPAVEARSFGRHERISVRTVQGGGVETNRRGH